MAKFKVLVIAHSVKNNKIAKCGDVIDESQLNSSAYELVNAGFIEEVKVEESVEDLEVDSEEVKAVKKPIKKK